MEPEKNNGMTIEELAEMVAKGFEQTTSDITALRDEMNTRFDGVEIRLDSVELRVGSLEKRFDDVEDKYRLLDTRVTNLEGSVHTETK